MLVTLGRRNGVMDLPFGKFRAGWLARKLKADHMLVPGYRKGIGLAPRPKVRRWRRAERDKSAKHLEGAPNSRRRHQSRQDRCRIPGEARAGF